MTGSEMFWVPLGILHIVFTIFSVASYQTNEYSFKHWWTKIILLIPIVNVIITILQLDVSLNVYKQHIRRVEDERNEKSRKIIILERSIADLERRKFRKVRVGDVFMCPDITGWAVGFRGQKHTIIEINEDLTVTHPVITTSKEGIRYKNTWDSLRQMIFLSDEPVKPFEFLCEKE